MLVLLLAVLAGVFGVVVLTLCALVHFIEEANDDL